MRDDDPNGRILAFANLCGTGALGPEAFARLRGWLDGGGGGGDPTADGAAPIDAAEEQEATRTVFRLVP